MANLRKPGKIRIPTMTIYESRMKRRGRIVLNSDRGRIQMSRKCFGPESERILKMENPLNSSLTNDSATKRPDDIFGILCVSRLVFPGKSSIIDRACSEFLIQSENERRWQDCLKSAK